MSIDDFSLYDTDELERHVKLLANDVANTEALLASKRARLAAFQQELDQRAVDAFWEAHPGLRLEVGDKEQS